MTKSKLFILISLLATASMSLQGQSYYGGVRGTVADPNGGAIAGAKVTLMDEGTGTQRATLSTAAGEFVFSEVTPSTYSVMIESPGFKRFQRKGVIIGTQQQVSLDLKLEIGQVSESVQVTEDYDDTQSSSSVFATPTAAERLGDFSKSLSSSGALLTIYD